MLEPGAVSALLRLKELGFGTRRIARTLGISRNTVKSHIEAGGWRAYKQPARRKILDGQESWHSGSDLIAIVATRMSFARS